jgi:hypothetical protein
MDQEIINKLHTALYTVSPLASERERIIDEIGDTVWLETIEQILVRLPEDKRTKAIALLNEDEVEKVLEIAEGEAIDITPILEDISKKVLDEVLASAKE